MTDVKRYDVGGDYGYGYCDESVDGEWVYASDYDALAQQLAASQEDARGWRAMCHVAQEGKDELRGKLESARATITRLEAMATERDKQLAEAVGLLREHEWQYQPYDDYYHKDAGYRCPECGAYKEDGHASHCTVGAYLAKHEHTI